MINIQNEIFTFIKLNVDSKFKDSLVNVLYLKKTSYGLCGDLAEHVLTNNLSRIGLPTTRIGQKTKNKFDSKTDIVVLYKKKEVPFSVKTSLRSETNLKQGLSKGFKKLILKSKLIDNELLNALKKEISANLYIIHANRKSKKFILELKKINLKNAYKVQNRARSIIINDDKGQKLIKIDKGRFSISGSPRVFDIIDFFVLGNDNSIEKEEKGESLLINKIITEVCLCNIDKLRKIEKLISKEISKNN